MDPKRKPVPAGGQPTPAAIANADSTPPLSGAPETPTTDGGGDSGAGGDDGELVDARVLVAFGDYVPDDIVSASADAIEQLKLDGCADPHADAVAYARSLQA